MSFQPQLTFSDAGGACPYTLQLAPGQDVRIFSVLARWDGSGAAASYHPCLSLYSQDDKLVSRTRPEQTFAAGDSGVVTYAPFLHSEPPAAPTVVPVVAAALNTQNVPAGTAGNQVIAVPDTLGSTYEVTPWVNGNFENAPVVSPDRAHVAFLREDSSFNDNLYVCDADGANVTALDTVGNCGNPQWLDNTTIIYYRSSRIRRVDRDGTNAAVIIAKSGIAALDVSPFGDKIVYSAQPGATPNIYTVNPDGTGDTLLVAGPVAGNGPAYYADGTRRILYDTQPAFDIRRINEDGTGDTLLYAGGVAGFWLWLGMHTDRMFYTHVQSFPSRWKLGQIMLDGSGVSDVSPDLWVMLDTHAGIPVVADGRVFTVTDGTRMPEGVNSLVSILPDGSDYKVHFECDESSAPFFQNLFFIVNQP